MPKSMDPILPMLSILGYWAVILGTLEVQVRVAGAAYIGVSETAASMKTAYVERSDVRDEMRWTARPFWSHTAKFAV